MKAPIEDFLNNFLTIGERKARIEEELRKLEEQKEDWEEAKRELEEEI